MKYLKLFENNNVTTWVEKSKFTNSGQLIRYYQINNLVCKEVEKSSVSDIIQVCKKGEIIHFGWFAFRNDKIEFRIKNGPEVGLSYDEMVELMEFMEYFKVLKETRKYNL